MQVGSLLPGEWRPALALAFRDAQQPRERIDKFTALIEAGAFDPDGIRVLRSPQGIEGVLLCQMLAGANGQILPPAWVTGDARARLALVRDGIDWLRERHARFIHLLVRPGTNVECVVAAGFRSMTRIRLLHHALKDILTLRAMPAGLSLHSYTPALAPRFMQTLADSFEGTLDIPELHGVRSPEEVLTGLQGDGWFRPEAWKLVCLGEIAAGLLLLIEKPDIDGWELSYVGLLPRFRRRGIGSWLVTIALQEAVRHEARQLYVSVDVRNAPALQLYSRAGFSTLDEHELLLYFFK